MQITWSVFPKFQHQLSPHELAEFVREVGVDTVNMVVREGFWVTPANLANETKAFVEAMHHGGIEIHYATTSYTAEQLLKDPTPLAVFADNGVRAFRMGYFESKKPDVRGELKRAREQMSQLASLCEKHKVRAIYQLHHGTLIASPSAAYAMIEELPADAVAIELDPGNQSREGYEDYLKSARLLGKSVGWCGIKDTAIVRDASHASQPDKGWKRDWAPAYEGVVRWDELFKALAEIDFRGVCKFMPFYDETNPAEQRKKLKREVEYIKKVAAAAQ